MTKSTRTGGSPALSTQDPLPAAAIAMLVEAAGPAGLTDRRARGGQGRLLRRRGLLEPSSGGWTLTTDGRAALAALGAGGGAARAAATGPAMLPDDDGVPRAVLRHEAESPLAWLRRRRQADGRPMLDDAAFAAGERFRAELTRAMMLPRVTANWDRAGTGGVRASGPAEASDAALAARQRVRAASAAVGRDLAGLLVDVCGFLKGLEEIERERGWPARSAKVVLQIALGRLAEHYGYGSEIRGPRHGAGIRAWTG